MAAAWFHNFLQAIGFSQVPGYRRVTALGNNPDVDTGAAEEIWTAGGIYPFMTAATSLEIVSSSAADDSAGTGARTVLVNGLDAAYAEVA